MCRTFDPLSNFPITELEADGFLRTFKELLLVVTKINSFFLFGSNSREKKIFPEIIVSVVFVKFDSFAPFDSRVMNTFPEIF